MTQDLQVEHMPVTAHIARFILTLQMGAGFAGIALCVYLFASSGFAAPFLLLLLASAAVTALLWLVVARWPSRRRPVRWAAIAIQAATGALILAKPLFDSDISLFSTLFQSAVPAATVILLAVPSTARWFGR
ncbi:hypothetical protein [Nonomuraea sp. GTA35]|uniref:hypothetical protein n=1 Tax=Nonomuraea sp. GTA35 TaxID=1676746 RepID=UPI0035C24530